MTGKTKKIVVAAMLAAVCCVATMFLKIPSPLKGYINLGDCVVLLCGCFLSPVYGFLAAGIGSALADVFAGYVVYVPATFLVKGLMSLTMYWGCRFLNNKIKKAPSRIISGAAAELIMTLGYFLFEGFLYGFAVSAANMPFNAVQAVAGLVSGIILINVFDKSKILM